jgi:hypothetical protein
MSPARADCGEARCTVAPAPGRQGEKGMFMSSTKGGGDQVFWRGQAFGKQGYSGHVSDQLAYCGSVRQPGFLFASASVRAGDHHPHRRGDLLQAILMGGGSYKGRFNPAGTGISSSLN